MNGDHLKELRVKALIPLFALVVMLVDLPILAASDTNYSLTARVITGGKTTVNQSEAGNSMRVP